MNFSHLSIVVSALLISLSYADTGRVLTQEEWDALQGGFYFFFRFEFDLKSILF